MKLIFAGTPQFAAGALQSLLDAGHEIALVLTQPDRPGGRGMKLQVCPVKHVASAAGLNILQPPTLRDLAVQKQLSDCRPDAMVVAAYGLILPQAVLDIPPLGAINIHASLLPRWRGAAPIQRALLAGDKQSGITIMRMEAGLDTGPILLQEVLDIEENETAQSLHDKLAGLGAQAVVRALQTLRTARPIPQPEEGVTYAQKLSKSEARINWKLPAIAIDRGIRAYCPFPGAFTNIGGTEVKVWGASLSDHAIPAGTQPGQVVQASAEQLIVACGQGSLALLAMQRPGGKKLSVADFLRGFPIEVGARFEKD